MTDTGTAIYVVIVIAFMLCVVAITAIIHLGNYDSIAL